MSGTIEIAINDDDVAESLREAFTVSLTAPERNPVFGLGLEATSTVTIAEGVCDRTQPLSDAVVETLGVATCAAVDDLTDIVELDLSERAIERLKQFDFLGMTALAHLDLSGNRLTELPLDAFTGPFRLQTLSLRSNRLTVLSDYVFELVRELRQIDLGGNRLTALPSGLFENNPQLGELHLDDNALAALPAGIFSGLHMLRVLQLQNNPGAPFALAVDLARTDDRFLAAELASDSSGAHRPRRTVCDGHHFDCKRRRLVRRCRTRGNRRQGQQSCRRCTDRRWRGRSAC